VWASTLDPVPPDQLNKIVVGWNVAFDKKIQRLVPKFRRSLEETQKNTDVICRASVKSDWVDPLRLPVQTELESIRDDFNVLTPANNVSQRVYNSEMLTSRICVSPFGYGEVCWRDFEAILAGCVLVKPDMSHVETYPDVFIPEVTYVPVDWDYANLAPVIRRLSSDPVRCDSLRSSALQVLNNAFERKATVDRIATVLAPVLGGTNDPRTRPWAPS